MTVIGHSDGRVQVRDINEGTTEEDIIEFEEEENIFASVVD